jgi:hypothetical protein
VQTLQLILSQLEKVHSELQEHRCRGTPVTEPRGL